MAIRFHVEENLTEVLVGQVAALVPYNPFYTWNYVRAMGQHYQRVVLFSLYDGEVLLMACPAGIRRGFMTSFLEIESIPDMPDTSIADQFWRGIFEFCSTDRISDFRVGSYSSLSVYIPRYSGEIERHKRWEYILDLDNTELWRMMRKGHKACVNKARRNNLKVRETTDEAAGQAHLEVSKASRQRREERGEKIAEGADLAYFMNFLDTGAGRLYQAVTSSGKVVSSLLMLLSRDGAYAHSSGSNPEGMDLGAAQFLWHHLSLGLQEDGKKILNMGGADQVGSGLELFKTGFGANRIPLETALFYLKPRLLKQVRSVIHTLRRNLRR